MENVEMSVDKGVLTLSIDLNQTLRQSKSGKNAVVATSGGNQAMLVDGIPGLKLGINVFRPIVSADKFDKDGKYTGSK